MLQSLAIDELERFRLNSLRYVQNLWRSSFKQLILDCDAKILATFIFKKILLYFYNTCQNKNDRYHNSHDVCVLQ